MQRARVLRPLDRGRAVHGCPAFDLGIGAHLAGRWSEGFGHPLPVLLGFDDERFNTHLYPRPIPPRPSAVADQGDGQEYAPINGK